jgi:hypothetical protein
MMTPVTFQTVENGIIMTYFDDGGDHYFDDPSTPEFFEGVEVTAYIGNDMTGESQSIQFDVWPSSVWPYYLSLTGGPSSDYEITNSGGGFCEVEMLEISLVSGLQEIKLKVFEPLKPDVVIVIDTHWFTIVEFIVSSHKRRQGFYTSDELPRTMNSIPFDITGDPELADSIAERVTENGVRCSTNNNKHLPIHYPTVNMLEYLQGDEQWLSMSICATANKEQFMRVGKGLREAIEQSDKRVVILGSGGLSHKFWPLD